MTTLLLLPQARFEAKVKTSKTLSHAGSAVAPASQHAPCLEWSPLSSSPLRPRRCASFSSRPGDSGLSHCADEVASSRRVEVAAGPPAGGGDPPRHRTRILSVCARVGPAGGRWSWRLPVLDQQCARFDGEPGAGGRLHTPGRPHHHADQRRHAGRHTIAGATTAGVAGCAGVARRQLRRPRPVRSRSSVPPAARRPHRVQPVLLHVAAQPAVREQHRLPHAIGRLRWAGVRHPRRLLPRRLHWAGRQHAAGLPARTAGTGALVGTGGDVRAHAQLHSLLLGWSQLARRVDAAGAVDQRQHGRRVRHHAIDRRVCDRTRFRHDLPECHLESAALLGTRRAEQLSGRWTGHSDADPRDQIHSGSVGGRRRRMGVWEAMGGAPNANGTEAHGC